MERTISEQDFAVKDEQNCFYLKIFFVVVVIKDHMIYYWNKMVIFLKARRY